MLCMCVCTPRRTWVEIVHPARLQASILTYISHPSIFLSLSMYLSIHLYIQALVDSIIQAIALSRKHDGLIFRYKTATRALKDWIVEHTEKWNVCMYE